MAPTIAIASGKGGTGKTTLAVNLAAVADGPVTLADCDVEAPNDHLFLHPDWDEVSEFCVPLPEVDADKCTGCGACRDVCRFGAVILLGDRPMIYPQLCHGCGGCTRACPTGAMTEKPARCGEIRSGRIGDLTLVDGRMDIGQVKAPHVVRAVRRKAAAQDSLVLIDAPPGTSCPVVAAVLDADYLVLVTEPTPFGLHDLKLAVEMAGQIGLSIGVVLNRAGLGFEKVTEYCHEANIEMLEAIPFDPKIAAVYAEGGLLVEEIDEYRQRFTALLAKLLRRADGEGKS